jgi:hypothetical protein
VIHSETAFPSDSPRGHDATTTLSVPITSPDEQKSTTGTLIAPPIQLKRPVEKTQALPAELTPKSGPASLESNTHTEPVVSKKNKEPARPAATADSELKKDTETSATTAPPIFHKITIGSTGYIPGLAGRLNPILDSENRSYLYADNIAIDGGKGQPVDILIGRQTILEDASGNRFTLRFLNIAHDSSVIEYAPQPRTVSSERTDLKVTVRNRASKPIQSAQLLVLFPDGTHLEGLTDAAGQVRLLHPKDRVVTIYCAHKQYAAFYQEMNNNGSEVVISLAKSSGTGSIIMNGTGYVPDLAGRLNPILDRENRRYLYASNISINNGARQPVSFQLNENLHLEDAKGGLFQLRVVAMKASSSLVEFVRIASSPAPSPQPVAQPELGVDLDTQSGHGSPTLAPPPLHIRVFGQAISVSIDAGARGDTGEIDIFRQGQTRRFVLADDATAQIEIFGQLNTVEISVVAKPRVQVTDHGQGNRVLYR